MGRKRTHLQLTPTQRACLDSLLKENPESRVKERLRFLHKAATGRYTLEELAQSIGRSRSTIQNWLSKFEENDVKGLTVRRTPPGRRSPLGNEKILEDLRASIEAGTLRTAKDVASWLKREHGVTRSRKSIYYWFRRRKLR